MSTALQSQAMSSTSMGDPMHDASSRKVMRCTGVLVAALSLTTVVLLALSSVVDTWS